MIRTHDNKLDITGVGLSIGCAVHCLALPVAAAFAPSLSAFAEAEWVHWAVLALATPVALLALYVNEAPNLARALAFTGLGAMLLGALEIPSHEAEAWVSAFGGTLLATGHIVNIVSSHRRRTHANPPCAPEVGEVRARPTTTRWSS